MQRKKRWRYKLLLRPNFRRQHLQLLL